MPSPFACQVWLRNLRSPLDWGAQTGWVSFRIRDAISQKRCEIELRWQLITNRKVICGLSIATQVDDLEWPWTSIHCFVVSFMRVATKWLRIESRGFHYKVALYHSYLRIKFDDDIQGGPFIWGSQNRVEWFSTSWHHILKTVRDRA